MKYIIFLFLIFFSINCFSQVKIIITESGDTVYQMSKTDFQKFYDIMIDASVCKENEKISEQQLKDRELQVKYLKDSVLYARGKIDSLNEQIIKNLNEKNKPKSFKINGLFAEGNFLYNPIDSSSYFDLGINFKMTFFDSFELSPGIKGFYYKNKFNFGPFIRAEIKIY